MVVLLTVAVLLEYSGVRKVKTRAINSEINLRYALRKGQVITKPRSMICCERSAKRMLWNKDNFPQSFTYLSEATRQKAIDVASELLRQGMDEYRAIHMALEHALIWARSRSVMGESGLLPLHVIPVGGSWGVQSEDAAQPNLLFATREEALFHAQEIAHENQLDVILHDMGGKIQERSTHI
jgi:uncharacterized protein DUF2188